MSQTPSFYTGERLTAESLNELANLLATALRGRINTGLVRPPVAQSSVIPVEPMGSTGQPAMLDVRRGLNYDAAPGIYVRKPSVVSVGQALCSLPCAVTCVAGASCSSAGETLWHVSRTDCYGTPTCDYLTFERPDTRLWDPSTSTPGVLAKRLSVNVVNCKWGACAGEPSNRVLPVNTNDVTLPELTRSVPVLAPVDPSVDDARELRLTAGRRGNTALLRRAREGGGMWLNHCCYGGCCAGTTLSITTGFDLYEAHAADGGGVPALPCCVTLHPSRYKCSCWQTLGTLNTGTSAHPRDVELRVKYLRPWAAAVHLYAPDGVGHTPVIKLVTCDTNTPQSYMTALAGSVITQCVTVIDRLDSCECSTLPRRVQWQQITAPAPACYTGYDLLVGRYWRQIDPSCTEWAPHATYSY